MRRFASLLVLVGSLAWGQTIKLYLKDGDYQLVREYQVEADRIRYYSTERADWEEIPLDLVDLDRTKREVAARAQSLAEDTKAQAEEDAALRAERKEIASVPYEPGAYFIGEGKLEPLKQAEMKIVNDKKRSILKVLTPVPVVSGKSTVEIDGETASFKVSASRPEFYFRLASEERFGIIKLTRKKGIRVVENVAVLPVVNEIQEEQQQVPTFKRQLADQLYKIWPEKPLEAGEYALIEFTDGKLNPQIWDFTISK